MATLLFFIIEFQVAKNCASNDTIPANSAFVAIYEKLINYFRANIEKQKCGCQHISAHKKNAFKGLNGINNRTNIQREINRLPTATTTIYRIISK